MKKRKFSRILALVACCAVMLCSCSKSGESSSVKDSGASSVSQSESEALESSQEQNDSSEQPSETSSVTDDSSELEKELSDITPAMWVVTDKNGTKMTLMGSMHALTEADYPLPKKITDALDNADTLAVECDTSAVGLNEQMVLLKNMKLESGKTIKDVLSKDGYAGLENASKLLGIPMETFKRLKPWAVQNTLESYVTMAAGLDSNKGIDGNLISMAKEKGKEIYEVESANFQFDLLMNASDTVYDVSLIAYKNVKTVDEMIQPTSELYSYWRKGEFEKLTKLLESEDEDTGDIKLTDEQIKVCEEYNDAMLGDRNKGMVKAIKELLEKKKNVFYVVGAAHYAGEGGILDLLKKDGYTVERIEY